MRLAFPCSDDCNDPRFPSVVLCPFFQGVRLDSILHGFYSIEHSCWSKAGKGGSFSQEKYVRCITRRLQLKLPTAHLPHKEETVLSGTAEMREKREHVVGVA